MMRQEDVRVISDRLAALSGEEWALGYDSDGVAAVSVRGRDGGEQMLRVKREFQNASVADVVFIAHARNDVRRLLAALRQATPMSADELSDIEHRMDEISPGPWMVSLESGGGLAGCNVITVSHEDDEPDMYLWLEGDLAPDPDWVFAAHARHDIPMLLSAARSCDD